MGINIDFSKQKLPPIYKRDGRDCYLDPVRERLIFITPEETVRQQVISYLLYELDVPKRMIRVEDSLRHFGIDDNKRTDILITKYDKESNSIMPLCVIECKAPNVGLTL